MGPDWDHFHIDYTRLQMNIGHTIYAMIHNAKYVWVDIYNMPADVYYI